MVQQQPSTGKKNPVMSFGSKTDCAKDLQVVITGAVIEQKSEIPLLEVNLDDQLPFLSHVSNIFERTSSRIRVLLRLGNLMLNPLGAAGGGGGQPLILVN